MLWITLLSAALAGTLIVDAEVPTEIWLDGQPVVQLFRPAEVRLPAEPGKLPVVVMVDGNRSAHEVEVPEEGAALLAIGRTGITTDSLPPEQVQAVPRIVEFKVSGDESVALFLDGGRHHLNPGDTLRVELGPGNHDMSLRNGRGTVVWAAGSLTLKGTGPVLVQVTSGKMPEVSGGHGAFLPVAK